jgi:2-hydroxychromene-2-carboxylate isomerase
MAASGENYMATVKLADKDHVGEVIHLSERLSDRSPQSIAPAAFFFSLDCPVSYLAAERVERALGDVTWIPVVGPLSESSGLRSAEERLRLAHERLALAENEARMFSLPLLTPHRYPMDSRRAARAAIWAGDEGRGASFALRISRFAFCGGFDIGSDEVIAEAAAGAGLDPVQALEASLDARRDDQLEATARGLQTRGILMPPVIRIGTRWFCGSDAMMAAVSFSAGQARESGTQLPVS